MVFSDLRLAIDDVILKHQVALDELFVAMGWIQRLVDAGEPQPAGILFFKTVRKATEGAAFPWCRLSRGVGT